MKVTSNSAYLQANEENSVYTINCGTLRKGANTNVEILITDVTHISASKTCQCTQPIIEIMQNGVKLTIKYDNNKVGTINQQVKETVKDGAESKTIIFNLRGQII